MLLQAPLIPLQLVAVETRELLEARAVLVAIRCLAPLHRQVGAVVVAGPLGLVMVLVADLVVAAKVAILQVVGVGIPLQLAQVKGVMVVEEAGLVGLVIPIEAAVAAVLVRQEKQEHKQQEPVETEPQAQFLDLQ